MKKTIDLADVQSNDDERAEWNNTPLEQMVLIDKDGNKVEVTKEEAEEWAFIGLSNFYFLLKKLDETST